MILYTLEYPNKEVKHSLSDSILYFLTDLVTPKVANKGDIFVRVDVLPNRVYKFDNTKWVELNKQVNKSYLNEDAYLEHLIHLIDQGQCDIEDCTEAEKAAIEDYLVKNKK